MDSVQSRQWVPLPFRPKKLEWTMERKPMQIVLVPKHRTSRKNFSMSSCSLFQQVDLTTVTAVRLNRLDAAEKVICQQAVMVRALRLSSVV